MGITPDGQSKDMSAFRQKLIEQMKKEAEAQEDEFSGYSVRDILVQKWNKPYDLQLKKTTIAGRPMVHLNVLATSPFFLAGFAC